MHLMIYQRASFEDLLRERIGLDAASIGTAAMDRAVVRRMKACGISDAFPYLTLARTSQDELDELVEEVIVPETWFFRNFDTFHLLAKHALTRIKASVGTKNFRVLSVPCSTGEEPYSVAMALFDAGVPSGHFHIDAVDISRKTLRFADRAVYGNNSFRGKNLEFQSAFFEIVENGFQLVPFVRQKVRFIRDNVLRSTQLCHQQPYDVIFCRNLFIYLEASAKRRVLGMLTGLLKSEGLLFVGPAETSGIPGPDFVSIPPAKAFAYRRRIAEI